MGPVSIGVEVQRNTDGDTPSRIIHVNFIQIDPASCVIKSQQDVYSCVYLRIKSLFFYLHDVMKTVGGVKIP